jgi:hypothetical protein
LVPSSAVLEGVTDRLPRNIGKKLTVYATQNSKIAQMSILRYTFLILVTYHQATLYLREQGCKDLWLFFEAKRGLRAKKLGNTALMQMTVIEVDCI